MSFSEIYNESQVAAQKLLCEHPEVKIVEMPSSSGVIERHIQIDSQDYGPIDEIANQILGKKEKTSADLAIAGKLSSLYGDFIRENDLESQPIRVKMRNIQLLRFPAKLLQASEQRPSEIRGFLNAYQNDPNVALNLLQSDEVEIREVTSWRGKVTRCIFIAGQDYGPIDELSERIIAKENKSFVDVKLAQKLSKLYRNLYESIQFQVSPSNTPALNIERKRFINLLQDVVYKDFVDKLGKRRKIELERLYGKEAYRTFTDISTQTAQEELTSICFMYTNKEGKREEKSMPVRKEFKDSIKRGFSEQATGILESSDLHPDILYSGVLEEIRERKKSIEDLKLRIEQGEDLQSELEVAEDGFYDSLSKAFLMDLYFKLGDQKFLILDILLFLEQTFTGHLTSQLNGCLPGPKFIPKYMNPERTITIRPHQVELTLVLDCSREYKEMGEDTGGIEPLPFGVRTTLKVILAENPGNTAILATAEKLDDAPTSRVFSDKYPIIIEPSSGKGNISEPGSPTTTGESMTPPDSRTATPGSTSSGDFSPIDPEDL